MIATVVAGTGAGAVIDLFTRRVPNALTAVLAASGVVFAACGISGITIGASLTGFALGLALMLPGHLFGATGAGDVKLFAAIGALVGPAPILTAFLYTALAGGAIAVAVSLRADACGRRSAARRDWSRRRPPTRARSKARSSTTGSRTRQRLRSAPCWRCWECKGAAPRSRRRSR